MKKLLLYFLILSSLSLGVFTVKSYAVFQCVSQCVVNNTCPTTHSGLLSEPFPKDTSTTCPGGNACDYSSNGTGVYCTTNGGNAYNWCNQFSQAQCGAQASHLCEYFPALGTYGAYDDCVWANVTPPAGPSATPTNGPSPTSTQSLTCGSTCVVSRFGDPCKRATRGCTTCSNQSGGTGTCIGPTATPRPSATPTPPRAPTPTPTPPGGATATPTPTNAPNKYFISGHAYDVTSGTPLIYTGGNATITLCTVATCPFINPLDPQTFRTNVFGTYQFNNLNSGQYYVKITPPATFIVKKPINPNNQYFVTVGAGCFVGSTGALCTP